MQQLDCGGGRVRFLDPQDGGMAEARGENAGEEQGEEQPRPAGVRLGQVKRLAATIILRLG